MATCSSSSPVRDRRPGRTNRGVRTTDWRPASDAGRGHDRFEPRCAVSVDTHNRVRSAAVPLPRAHGDCLLLFVDSRGMIVDSRGTATMPKPSDLLQGTLDLLILRTIARKPLHGWGIAKRIQTLSGDTLSVGQGSLYPALHRLENQGWICAEWEDSDLGRPAKVYSLTPEGRKQLERELKSWNRLSSAVRLLIQNA